MKIKTYFKGGGNISLPITKKQFEDSIPDFIHKFKRLPYMKEDDVEVKIKNDNGEIESKPYRARKYIREYYDNQDNMTEELFDKGVISYESIADVLGLTPTLVKNAMTLSTKNPEIKVRRKLDIFFNKDFYENELGKYNTKCMGCGRRKCKQDYYVDIISCKRYKEKKKK